MHSRSKVTSAVITGFKKTALFICIYLYTTQRATAIGIETRSQHCLQSCCYQGNVNDDAKPIGLAIKPISYIYYGDLRTVEQFLFLVNLI